MEWLLVGVALLLACALVFVPKLNVFTDTVLTLYHEIGHNVVLLGFFLVGARPAGMRIYPNGDGSTGHDGLTLPGLAIVRLVATPLVFFGGAAFPILLALASVSAFLEGGVEVVYGVVTAITVGSALFLRNAYGFGVWAVASAYLGLGFMNDEWKPALLLLFATFLLVSSAKDLAVTALRIIGREEGETDFHLLGEEWFGGPLFWFVTFFVVEGVLLATCLMPLWTDVVLPAIVPAR